MFVIRRVVMPKKDTKKDPMDAILANIEKSMGRKNKKPKFARFGNIEAQDIPILPFGIKAVDEASNGRDGGGVPRGKMVEIFGPESSGKSLLTLYLMASAQKQGLECVLIDVEQSFDPYWAAQHGVNVDKLVWNSDFESGDEALEYAFQFCKSGKFGVVVIDSTAALTPKSELEGSLEDNARVGAQAALMSRACRKIIDACGRTETTCVFINQLREKIGVMFGNPETTPGGKALKFYAHQRLRVSPKTKIKVKEEGLDKVVGQISTVTFVKNKTAAPFGRAEFKIIFDAKSLNPVVMLANALRSAKMIAVRNKMFNIPKAVANEVFDESAKIDTDATTMLELADWLIKEDKVIPMLEYLVQEFEEDPEVKEKLKSLDGAMTEMLTDHSKIVSPLDDVTEDEDVTFDAKKIADADPNDAEIKDELEEQEIAPKEETVSTEE